MSIGIPSPIGRMPMVSSVNPSLEARTIARIAENQRGWAQEASIAAAKNGASRATPRTFVAKDPGVPELINAIETKFPGKVRNAEILVYRPDGTPYTDFDIVTDTHVIQVKLGTGKGIVTQIQNTQSLTNLEVIGFDVGKLLGKNQSFKGSIMKDASQKDIFITNDVNVLLKKIGPTKPNGG